MDSFEQSHHFHRSNFSIRQWFSSIRLHFDRWVRWHIITDDPYDQEEQAQITQSIQDQIETLLFPPAS
jgi:hypothetical protein